MAGRKKATLRDVAAAAGVAESTVSRAFSGHAPISEDTRTQIFEAADRVGYVYKSKAPADPRHERKGIIGVICATLHNSFYPALLDRLHRELDALGYEMVLIIDDQSNSSGSRKIQSLLDTSFDGVIFTTAAINSPSVDYLAQRGVPIVLAIRSNRLGNVDVVESDNLVAGADAVRHLLALGHRDIGFVMGPQETSTAVDRFNGGLQILQQNGISVPDEWIIWSDYSHEGGYSGVVHLNGLERRPTAIICGNDVIAIGALDACIKLNVRVPDDVSIIGFDDIPMASWSMISLTTIRQSIGEIGAKAARRIVARIEGKTGAAVAATVLPTSFVQRGTTAPPKR